MLAGRLEEAHALTERVLALAEELGMRPLVAHCHQALGTLYRKVGPAGTGPRGTGDGPGAVPRHGDDLLAAPGGGGAGTDGMIRCLRECGGTAEGAVARPDGTQRQEPCAAAFVFMCRHAHHWRGHRCL
jgi:hypothetical protein